MFDKKKPMIEKFLDDVKKNNAEVDIYNVLVTRAQPIIEKYEKDINSVFSIMDKNRSYVSIDFKDHVPYDFYSLCEACGVIGTPRDNRYSPDKASVEITPRRRI